MGRGGSRGWWVMGCAYPSLFERDGQGKLITFTNEALKVLVFLLFAHPAVSRGFGGKHLNRDEHAA